MCAHVLVMPGRHAMIMRQSYLCVCIPTIYIVSYNSHGHSVFINGAATVSIESEGISNPHEDAVLVLN